jgi:cytochrome P450
VAERYSQHVALPPGPPGPPIVQLLRLIRDPMAFMERCTQRYGTMFTLRWPGMGKLVYVVDPALIKEIFTGDARVFHAGEANQMLEPVLGPRSVLLLDDAEHLRQRRLLLPPFHGESVRRYGEVMSEEASRELDRWPLGTPFPLRERMQAITLEVILRAVFGIQEAWRLERFRALIPKLLQTSNLIVWMPMLRREGLPFGPWRRFVRARTAVDQLLFDEIRRRRSGEGAKGAGDVLSLLLGARDEEGRSMSDSELRDELVTLLVAGHETTATGLSWAFERLLRHPAVMERLKDELESGEGSYLDAVVKETLRARPVVFDVGRMLTGDVQIGGHALPAGTYVVPAITGVHRNPSLYPDPEAFRPERFLDGQPESYAWIPFGGGARRCIGAAFATYEMKTVLRTILARTRLEAADPKDEKAKLHNVTLVPARNTRVVLRERLPATDVPAVRRESAALA